MKEFIEHLIKEITTKKKLANAKAILALSPLKTIDFNKVSVEEALSKVDEKELNYYVGYRQALLDVLYSLQGGNYKFTEYEFSRRVLDKLTDVE